WCPTQDARPESEARRGARFTRAGQSPVASLLRSLPIQRLQLTPGLLRRRRRVAARSTAVDARARLRSGTGLIDQIAGAGRRVIELDPVDADRGRLVAAGARGAI